MPPLAAWQKKKKHDKGERKPDPKLPREEYDLQEAIYIINRLGYLVKTVYAGTKLCTANVQLRNRLARMQRLAKMQAVVV